MTTWSIPAVTLSKSLATEFKRTGLRVNPSEAFFDLCCALSAIFISFGVQCYMSQKSKCLGKSKIYNLEYIVYTCRVPHFVHFERIFAMPHASLWINRSRLLANRNSSDVFSATLLSSTNILPPHTRTTKLEQYKGDHYPQVYRGDR